MSAIEQVRRKLKEAPLRWLVTGSAGFIGSHLVNALLELDQTVVGLDNFATGHQRNIDEVRAAVRLNAGLSRGLIFVSAPRHERTAEPIQPFASIQRVSTPSAYRYCAIRLLPPHDPPPASFARTTRADRPWRRTVVKTGPQARPESTSRTLA